MTEPVDNPFFGTDATPERDQTQQDPPAAEPEAEPVPPVGTDPQDVADEAAAAEPDTPQPPQPDWLTEVENNAPPIVARAISELFKLVRG